MDGLEYRWQSVKRRERRMRGISLARVLGKSAEISFRMNGYIIASSLWPGSEGSAGVARVMLCGLLQYVRDILGRGSELY